MTKEPSKDFRTEISKVIFDACRSEIDQWEARDKVIALCKEMLVQVRCVHDDGTPRTEFTDGWNAYHEQLLKQLGEK